MVTCPSSLCGDARRAENTLLEVKIVLGFFFKKSEIDINGWVELTLL
jgi:hypothetical protein